ncbi:MAG: lysophospholipid acyltransferase family protein, partial [Candidatus Tectomicrobia bacterium]
GKSVNVLVAPEQEAALQRLLRDGRRPAGLRFVTNETTGVFMKLLMALRRGEVVAFQADRAMGHRSDVTATFFGTPASFPGGPFTLAAAARVPVLPCFCLMRPDRRYDIFVDEPITVSRGCENVALQQMVGVLERYIAMAPDQWFNFYDLWNNSTLA